MQNERRDNSARVLVIMVFAFFIIMMIVSLFVVVTWWLESRFGPNAALIVWGLLIGVIVFGAGFVVARNMFLGTLSANAQQIEHIATAFSATSRVQTAFINMERDAQRHALKTDERIEREALRLGRSMSRTLASAQAPDDVTQFFSEHDDRQRRSPQPPPQAHVTHWRDDEPFGYTQQ